MSAHDLDNELLGAVKDADYAKMVQLLEWAPIPTAPICWAIPR